MTPTTTTEQRTVTAIVETMNERGHTYAWLSRVSGVKYKRLLAELKHRTRPLSLETAIDTANALGLELPELLALAA